jgi:predicted enzyme related to lactoylglutathione lyase
MSLRGFSTISFWADDVAAASAWYAEFLGVEAYFTRPGPDGRLAYAEFRVGDYQHELGIIDRRYAPAGHGDQVGGAIVYWHVADVDAGVHRLVELGAEVLEQPTQRGPGFVTASVIDPYRNVLGVMFNQHYLDVLSARSASRA